MGLKGGSIYIAGGNLRHGDRWSKDLVRGGEAHCKSGGSEETNVAGWSGEFKEWWAVRLEETFGAGFQKL